MRIACLVPFLLLGAPAAQACTRADVVVYGGTPSGVAAALQASAQDAKVVVLEPTDHIGGMMSNGLTRADVAPLGSEVYGGVAATFFAAMQAKYPENRPPRIFYESKEAESYFVHRLQGAGVEVFHRRELLGVDAASGAISELRTADGESWCGKMFIDASYEGDLIKKSGGPSFVGREAAAQYHERNGGVGEYQYPEADTGATLAISPFADPGRLSRGLALGMTDVGEKRKGAADDNVMAFNFRLCFTQAANRKRFVRPAGYDAENYVLALRWMRASQATGTAPLLTDLVGVDATVDGKFDINGSVQFSTDIPDLGRTWLASDWAERRRLLAFAEAYTRGLFYFLSTDERTPESVRTELKQYGLCPDEFTDNDNWPRQLYVREGRRLVGPYVFTQNDILNHVAQPDSIGLGYYPFDSHVVSRVDDHGVVAYEGPIKNSTAGGPYEIPMRVLYGGAYANLLAGVGVSASRAAFLSLRVEPTLMGLGQAAGALAALAIKDALPVQRVPYAQVRAQLLAAGQALAPVAPPASRHPSSAGAQGTEPH